MRRAQPRPGRPARASRPDRRAGHRPAAAHRPALARRAGRGPGGGPASSARSVEPAASVVGAAAAAIEALLNSAKRTNRPRPYGPTASPSIEFLLVVPAYGRRSGGVRSYASTQLNDTAISTTPATARSTIRRRHASGAPRQ